MTVVDTRSLAALLGIRPRKAQTLTLLDLADAVSRGLSVDAVERLCALIAPDDASLRYRIVPKATLARRQRTAARRLSAEESDRVARLARLWGVALDVWGAPTAAQRFLAEPHPLLGGRVPREVAIASQIGAWTVEQILGRLKYGTAV
jgi:putative toxin-antitoxin system antitoxin component (TIGR02293 family)